MQQILQNLKTSYQKISQSELVNMETLQSFDISESINRENLLSTIEHYLTIHEMEHNWDNIVQTPTPVLVNALSALIPFTPEEKQALLEAPDIESRAQTLLALTERSLMKQKGLNNRLN